MRLDRHFESSEFQNGLWPHRLAYDFEGTKGALEKEAQATTTLKALEKRVKEAQEALSKNHGALSKKVGTYNDNPKYVDKKYGTDDYGDLFGDNAKTKTKRRPQEQPIKLDFENLTAIKAQINKLKNADFFYNDQWLSMSQIAVSEGRGNQINDLDRILGLVKKHEELAEELRLREKEKTNGNAIRLVRKMEKVERMPELKSKLEEKLAYREAMLAFQRAAENPLLKDSDFERFWTLPEGETSDQQLRESRQWLFTILAEKTNRFESSKFLLGEEFGDDPVENKKNFPFIHHEWLKYSKANEIRTEAVNVEVENLEGKYGVKRNEIPKAIDAMITALGADGVDIKNEAAEVKASPPSEYFSLMADALEKILTHLYKKKEKIKKDSPDDTKRIPALDENIATLEGYMGLANRAKDYHIYNEQDAAKNQAFTREGLKKNPQVLMELIMMKFQKAMNIVDMPFGKEGGSYSRIPHPRIRRELIALVYDAGVSRYRRNREGKVVYDDNITDDYKWMLGKMAGPYFNHLEKGRRLSKEQSDFILFAYYGNLSLTRQKFLEEEVLAPLQRIKALMDSGKTGPDIEKEIAPLRSYIKGARPGEKLNETTLVEVLNREKQTLETWGDLHRKVEEIARIPDDAKTRKRKAIAAYIKEFKAASTPYEAIYGFNTKMIEQHHHKSEQRNIVYNALDFNARSKANYMERMGIRIEALYESYLTYQAQHPEMKVDDWTNLLLTKEGTDKLADMFENIIADTDPNVARGKEDFLVILRTLHNPELLSTEKPALRNAHPAVISLVKALQLEVEKQEKIRDAAEKGKAEVQARLEGSTFGDTVTEYVKGVIDMVIGPGQSIANRAAGAAILFMAYKLIRKGIKMEGPLGKIIAGLGIGVAIELVLKKMTGSGLLDRAKLTGIAEAMKGTHEYVLIEKGTDLMNENDISRSEHARALAEMNRVPFSDLIDWYEKTNSEGSPLRGNKRLKLPRQISAYNIVKGLKHEDEDARAAFVIKKAMQVFFTYVGNKEGLDYRYGFKATQERWVKAVKDPNFKLDDEKYTYFVPHQMLMEEFRGRPRELTWEVVLRAEVTTYDVELAQKQGVVEQIVEFGKDTINEAVRVVRQKIYAPGTVTAKQTWEKMGLYAPAVKEMFADLVTTGKEEFYITKNKVEIWYGAKEHLVVQFVGDHWELAKAGVRLPFEMIFAIDQAVIPWATVKIRQIEELLRTDQLVTTSNELALSDIIGSDLLTAGGALRTDRRGNRLIDDPDLLYDQEENANFKFLGYYSLPFMRAFNNAGGDKIRIMDGEAFEIDTTDLDSKNHNIGFLISAVDIKEAGVVGTDRPAQRFQKMQKAARDKAKKKFIENYKGKEKLTDGLLEDYMNTIHVVVQTAPGKEKNPNKLFVFYRMPMPDSHEFFLKELSRYPDYIDADRIKGRPPFRVNPKLSLFENLKEATGLNAYGTRKLGGYSLRVLSQWIRVSAFTIEKTGKLARGIVDLVPDRWLPPSQTRWITDFTSLSEKQKQAIDEIFESGASTNTALSNFYKQKGNSDSYRHALEVAKKGKVKDSRDRRMGLYLGHLDGRRGRGGRRENTENYNTRPSNIAEYNRALQKERQRNP